MFRCRRSVVLCGYSHSNLHLVHLAVGNFSRMDLPENNPETKHIRLRIISLTPQDLRRRILARPNASSHGPCRILYSRKSKISHFYHELWPRGRRNGTHEEIAGFEVAVDDTHAVQVCHSFADTGADCYDGLRFEKGLRVDQVEERAARH